MAASTKEGRKGRLLATLPELLYTQNKRVATVFLDTDREGGISTRSFANDKHETKEKHANADDETTRLLRKLHAEVHDGHHAGGEARRDAVLSEVPGDFEDIALPLKQEANDRGGKERIRSGPALNKVNNPHGTQEKNNDGGSNYVKI